jgi:hypothetical protein
MRHTSNEAGRTHCVHKQILWHIVSQSHEVEILRNFAPRVNIHKFSADTVSVE